MSLSIPTTCAPSFANRFTVSEPINPADPVTMIVRIYSTIIVRRFCLEILVTSLCEKRVTSLRPIPRLAAHTIGFLLSLRLRLRFTEASQEENTCNSRSRYQLHPTQAPLCVWAAGCAITRGLHSANKPFVLGCKGPVLRIGADCPRWASFFNVPK